MASINYQCQLIQNNVGPNKYHFPLKMFQHSHDISLLQTFLLSISTHIVAHRAGSFY